MNVTRRFFARLVGLSALLGAGVRRAWGQCSYVFFTCYDFGSNNCWGCGTISFAAWQDSFIIPSAAGTCLYCDSGCAWPYNECELTSVAIYERCTQSEEYSQRYAYICCAGC